LAGGACAHEFSFSFAFVLCFMGGSFHHRHSSRTFETMNVTITRGLTAFSSGVRSIYESSGFLHKEPNFLELGSEDIKGVKRRVIREIVDIRQ